MRDTRDEEGPRVPLKTILQNFLNHVENLEARKREGDDAYEKEFQALKAFSDGLKSQTSEYSCSEGEKEVNRKKNRYKDILPFDSTLVRLSDYPGIPGSDYINANYIKGASGSNAYIACQGPLPHTVNDFWRMVVETEVQVIVMACNEQEAGKHKCERYWSDQEDDEEEVQFGKYFVRLLKSREICPDFLVRTMRLRWTGEGENKSEEERTVCQFHYGAWPDHGIPTQVRPLLEMVRLIRDCQASETLPVLVHCSAGCGRTGTICAIDFIWGLLRTGKLTSDFSLYNLVRDMRGQRVAMVQTVDQYILVHRAVKELFLEQLKIIDSHPYENVDDDGQPLAHEEGISDQDQDDHDDDNSPNDYETVFVKTDHEARFEVMDQVLSQRMALSQKPMMGTAMLQSSISSKSSSPLSSMLSNLDSLDRPPQPPPKQRHLIDSKAIETRQIETKSVIETTSSATYPSQENKSESDIAAEFNRTNPHLFEPPQGTSSNSEAGSSGPPQKFKKGTLKLTQDESGNWKIEQNQNKEQISAVISAPEAATTDNNNTQSNNSKSGGSKKNSPKSKKNSNNSNNGDESNNSESILMRRPSIKKIKAFFQQQKEASSDLVSEAMSKLPTLGGNNSNSNNNNESKSVPNSLDRKFNRAASIEPQYSSLEKSSSSNLAMVASNSTSNKDLNNTSITAAGITQKSISSERLVLNSSNSNYTSVESKPLLPIKRSKSMKTIQKVGSSANQSTSVEDSSFGFEDSKHLSKQIAALRIPPPKPKRSLTNYDADSIKTHLSHYSSIKNTSSSSPNHSRQSSEDASPLAAAQTASTNQHRPSLNHILMASFDLAEQEASKISNQNIQQQQSPPLLQGGANHSSSHSSPSNSKYNSVTSKHSLRLQAASPTSTSNNTNDYVNVNVHDGKMAVALQAQRKLSEASLTSRSMKPRERRNSFREAIDNKSTTAAATASTTSTTMATATTETKSYESIWFESNKRASSPPYESIHFQEQQQQFQNFREINDFHEKNQQQQPRKISESSGLQSVSLVSEVMNKKLSLQKQNSSSSSLSSQSAGMKGPPPPYVQPPQPLRGGLPQQPTTSRLPPPTTSAGKGPAPQVPPGVPTYANVQFRFKDARPQVLSTKDDLVLTTSNNMINRRRPQNPTQKEAGGGKMVANRYSCGDFSQLFSQQQQTQGATPLVKGHFHSHSDCGTDNTGRSVSSVRLGQEFDVDVDAIAATMQGHSKGNAPNSSITSPQLKPLKNRAIGMISGVATNLKSRLSQLNTSPNHQTHQQQQQQQQQQPQFWRENSNSQQDHHQTPPKVRNYSPPTKDVLVINKRPSPTHGEQSPSVIPLTVPGADNTMPSFPYGYPERLDLKPVGARDPPAHFQRKQEYL